MPAENYRDVRHRPKHDRRRPQVGARLVGTKILVGRQGEVIGKGSAGPSCMSRLWQIGALSCGFSPGPLAVHHSMPLTLGSFGGAVSKLVYVSDVEAMEESVGRSRLRPEPDQQRLIIVGLDPRDGRAALVAAVPVGGR